MGFQQHFSQNVAYSASNDCWTVVETEVECRQRRDAYVKKAKTEGHKATKFSLGWQLMSYGGIGTGKAHFELWVKSYGANVEW